MNERQIPMVLIRNPRARRYVLRLRPDGSVRVTIPRGGSAAEAQHFANRHRDWLDRQLERLEAQPKRPAEWLAGMEILFRGESVKLQEEINGNGASGTIRVGTEVIGLRGGASDLRPAVEAHLWKLAAKQLPPRVRELADLHQLPARCVTVRNQKSRWGSCSRRGTISLNWRLIQSPPFVQDYIILHELCHLREMNHSCRFWREVEQVCPNFEFAEQWLKQHSPLLR
jgi:predicted metal-dependent hydrolase